MQSSKTLRLLSSTAGCLCLVPFACLCVLWSICILSSFRFCFCFYFSQLFAKFFIYNTITPSSIRKFQHFFGIASSEIWNWLATLLYPNTLAGIFDVGKIMHGGGAVIKKIFASWPTYANLLGTIVKSSVAIWSDFVWTFLIKKILLCEK